MSPWVAPPHYFTSLTKPTRHIRVCSQFVSFPCARTLLCTCMQSHIFFCWHAVSLMTFLSELICCVHCGGDRTFLMRRSGCSNGRCGPWIGITVMRWKGLMVTSRIIIIRRMRTPIMRAKAATRVRKRGAAAVSGLFQWINTRSCSLELCWFVSMKI